MKKLRFFILINIIIFLIFALTVVSRAEQVKRENAKTKLEQALIELPMEQNTVNVSTVKNKIKNDISDSKIMNENTSRFPVYTLVDGYEFKVEENGSVENIDNIDSIKSSNSENLITNDIDNETNNDNETEKKNILVKYQDDIKKESGITISTNKDGIVTINGKSAEKLFIKISNNIQISQNIASFKTWEEAERYYNRKRKTNKTKSNYIR